MERLSKNAIPVALLCGGRMLRLRDDPACIKPLISVGGRPLILHVIDHYIRNGFQKFFLAAGIQFDLLHQLIADQPWQVGVSVRVLDTGIGTTTGDRLKYLRPHLEAPIFAVSYSDTLSNINLDAALNSFLKSNRIGQVTASHLPTRFRILGIRAGESLVRGLADRPVVQADWVNGGCYFFNRDLWTDAYLGSNCKNIVLEEDILSKLAKSEQLNAYKHEGRWLPIDCDRDLEQAEIFTKGEYAHD